MPGENETQQNEQTTTTNQNQSGNSDQTQGQNIDKTQRRSLLNEQSTETQTDSQTPEQKAEAERIAKEAEGKTPKGAPEKYEPFTAPDGYELDEKVVAGALELFKEFGLTQEQAQKIVDFHGKVSLESAEAPYKEWADTQEKWVKEAKAEHGSKLDSVRASIGRAIDQLGPELGPKFREAMDFTGAGNNPAFVNALSKWASLIGEGSTVRGNGPTDGSPPGAKPTTAQALYPNLPSTAKG